MTRRHACVSLVAAATFAVAAADGSGDAELAGLRAKLLGSWLVAVSDQPLLRVIEFTAIDRTASGWMLSAQVGRYDEPSRTVRMSLRLDVEGRMLFDTGRLEMALEQAAPDRLAGSYRADPGAPIAHAMLERWPTAEIRARAETAQRDRTQASIRPPGLDVPPACAAFSGVWSGTWSNSALRRTWLWVMEIETDCSIRYAWRDQMGPPPRLFAGRIIDGELEIPMTDGRRTILRRSGDKVVASTTSPFVPAVHTAVLERVR